ncbi:MAG: proton-conducting membrane transporter [Mesorhizobium sp.]|nr:MAG: proton-conducting membrane transporter [Mesorhizobium sp.]
MSTFFYMLLAFVMGILAGWFIWGRLRGELDSLRGDLDRTRSERDRLKADSDRLKGELDACGRARADLESQEHVEESAHFPLQSEPAVTKTAAAKPAAKAAAPKKAAAPAKKAAAPKAAAAKADNLRRLIGIGPVNERLLKGLGVTTYAQIAAWTDADVKRIEEVLNFDGRIAREKWIEQAKLLAAGDEAGFARQFPTAGTVSNT